MSINYYYHIQSPSKVSPLEIFSKFKPRRFLVTYKNMVCIKCWAGSQLYGEIKGIQAQIPGFMT